MLFCTTCKVFYNFCQEPTTLLSTVETETHHYSFGNSFHYRSLEVYFQYQVFYRCKSCVHSTSAHICRITTRCRCPKQPSTLLPTSFTSLIITQSVPHSDGIGGISAMWSLVSCTVCEPTSINYHVKGTLCPEDIMINTAVNLVTPLRH